jgi:hypothetical protein
MIKIAFKLCKILMIVISYGLKKIVIVNKNMIFKNIIKYIVKLQFDL